MIIFRRDEETGIECGIDNYGVLFLKNIDPDCDDYLLEDTPENRERLMLDFDFYIDKRKGK